jgi:serine protease inhibitor
MQRKSGLITTIVAATTLAASAYAATAAPPNVAAADNAFGFRLLNALQKSTPNSNTILSPVSAAVDLSMVLNGATGQTRQEMLDALSLSGDNLNAVNEANARLLKYIRTPPKGIVLSVADSLWVNDRLAQLRPDYLQRIRSAYAARTTELDFSKPDAVRRVNAWALKQTHGRIANVVDRLDPAEVVLLLNAVYFNGKWAHQFDKSRTQPREFTLAGGKVEQVPRMVESGSFYYLETPDLQAIWLPFGTGDLAHGSSGLVMEVILPSKSSTLEALESQLTSEHWSNWKAQRARRSGTIELPRFELKVKYRLNEALTALGMKRVFHADGGDTAQLTDMLAPVTGHPAGQNFYISSVIQSAYWKVNEEGSEAAAVTTTRVRTALAVAREQPFHMVVDRPFFCAIEDQRSGALLFVGAVYDPR